jgi:hypothetical protein
MNWDVLRIIVFAAVAIFFGTFAHIALTKPYVARLGPLSIDRHNKPWQYWSVTTLAIVIAVAALVVALPPE